MTFFVGNEAKAEMATHILQFTFVGCEGFEFPVAYYPTAQVDPVTLFHLYWDIIYGLQQVNFFVHMAICDGAQANRAFIAMHFQDEKHAVSSSFTTTNPYSGHPHSFMMDSSVSCLYVQCNCTHIAEPGLYAYHLPLKQPASHLPLKQPAINCIKLKDLNLISPIHPSGKCTQPWLESLIFMIEISGFKSPYRTGGDTFTQSNSYIRITNDIINTLL